MFKATVLLIDDSALYRTRTRYVLESDFNVVEAADSVSALRALALRAFDAVVIDLEMPGEDAHALYDRLVTIAPNLAPGTVVNGSGSRDSSLEQWARGFGDRYVRKEDVFGLRTVLIEITALSPVED